MIISKSYSKLTRVRRSTGGGGFGEGGGGGGRDMKNGAVDAVEAKGRNIKVK